ncbi:unnamed protein product [Citrullus colocynthis]|uniref:Agglutinin domain-containing protein n=1 Tax=Citrullus colocynthis TaxID=252529 RepID=A0ABP0Z700_9ROSI
MVQLPKFAALKSKYNNKYLRYVNETSSPVRTFLQYSGKEILTPYTKLELEQAQSDPSLFHIKCCYNNKYWTFVISTYSTWTSSISTKLLDVKTGVRLGVPLILDGKTISTTSSFSGEYKWGETITKSENTNGITHEVTVPAMSTITGTLYATKGSCDIPFSYKQYDVLIAGNSVEYFLDDGVFLGTNYYNFKYDIKIVPITPI